MKKIIALTVLTLLAPLASADWFDDVRTSGNREDLYRVLYYMPKGGDLHNHLSGAVFPEWWYELALAQEANGYEYYTKVRINNCRDYGVNAFGIDPYFMMFRNITTHDFEQLSDCEKGEYKHLVELNEREKTGWLNSVWLDQPYEGRDEFFQTHWQRLNVLVFNPWLQAETMFRNMQAGAEEGLSYVEFQISEGPYIAPDGTPISANEAFDILRARLAERDARDTGVTVRFQLSILRFLPNAEEQLRRAYKLVHDNADLLVAVNMVGREDNDMGHPARFLPTMRDLRRQYSGVQLSIHAGEVDEPNYHVRDTLLLGADRIGHGINLITDDDTMRLMRHGPYLVEINLISNHLLNYINDFSQHPFPEYLRTGIPVALSTDDRGMWESNLSDEFFVGVTEFNLTWDEIKMLSRNSLTHAFVSAEERKRLLENYEERISRFEQGLERRGVAMLGPMPETRDYICRQYALCTK